VLSKVSSLRKRSAKCWPSVLVSLLSSPSPSLRLLYGSISILISKCWDECNHILIEPYHCRICIDVGQESSLPSLYPQHIHFINVPRRYSSISFGSDFMLASSTVDVNQALTLSRVLKSDSVYDLGRWSP